jgi:hypothetical protein
MYIIGREMYSQGYRRRGSKGRLVGGLTLDFALLSLWSMALYSCLIWVNGSDGLKNEYFSSIKMKRQRNGKKNLLLKRIF